MDVSGRAARRGLGVMDPTAQGSDELIGLDEAGIVRVDHLEELLQVHLHVFLLIDYKKLLQVTSKYTDDYI